MKTLFVAFLIALFIIGVVAVDAEEQQCVADQDGNCLTPSSTNNQQNEEIFSPPTTTNVESNVKIAKGSNEGGKPPEAKLGNCKDRYPNECNRYAKEGECDKNPGWMIVNCPASCRSCHLLDPKKRCDRNFLNISSDPIYEKGDMDRMFRSIPKVFGHLYDIEVVSQSPHIVVFHNFVTDEEIDAILESVSDNWERSTDTGATNEFGETGRILSKSRTSSNAWCRSRCENDPLVQNVLRKIEAVTRVPSTNYESFQILRYEVGQYYRTHHDMGPRQVHLSCGPRILTFFLYLSDVEEGGETAFPQLNIAVRPRKGSALLWPSTMSDNLMQQDPRTNHEAKPVIKGVKYAANSWIHSHDFQKTNLWGCTGAFDYL